MCSHSPSGIEQIPCGDPSLITPALPSGTVTFLFTEIEGSTVLWEWDREAMASAVECHMALLDATIHAYGGIHRKRVGDAVEAPFPVTLHALAAWDFRLSKIGTGRRGSRCR